MLPDKSRYIFYTVTPTTAVWVTIHHFTVRTRICHTEWWPTSSSENCCRGTSGKARKGIEGEDVERRGGKVSVRIGRGGA
jgi:hypothetical protein